MSPKRRICAALTAVAALVMCVRIAATWGVYNDMIDEPYHIGSGLAMWQAHRHVYGVQHPPLPRLAGSLPLYAAGVRTADPNLGQVMDDMNGFMVGHEVLMRGKYPYWTTLILARSLMLIFPAVAVIYVYLLGRYLAGPVVGCVGAVMFSTDPTLLGHGTWVATDVAACAGYLAATYHGLRLIAHPTGRRAGAAGIALGAALGCKFSCGIVLLALALVWLLRGRRALATLPRLVPLGLLGLVVAFVTLWAIYGFDFGRVDDLRRLEDNGPQNLPEWVRTTPLPMPTAIAGLSILKQHNVQGHPSYLNGKFSMDGFPGYFPEAILIKSPIALVLGLVMAVAMFAMSRRRPWLRCAAVLVPFGVFVLASMLARINIGIRHILPAIPFLYVFVALWLARGRLVTIAWILIVAAVVETALVHPDYISFFNGFVGGPKQGEKYLLDSNVDWGQDLWRAKTWLDANAKGRVVSLRTFGNPRLIQWDRHGWEAAPEGSRPGGWFVVSKNYSYDVYPVAVTDQRGVRRIERTGNWIRNRPLVAKIGSSIEVYDLDEPK